MTQRTHKLVFEFATPDRFACEQLGQCHSKIQWLIQDLQYHRPEDLQSGPVASVQLRGQRREKNNVKIQHLIVERESENEHENRSWSS